MDARSSNLQGVWARFFLYSFGVFLVYSAYGTLLSLQSSINVVDDLGTTGLATIYVTAVVFSVMCTPAILRKWEAKKCVCFSEIAYIIYIVANFYPSFYTIIPASIIVGMGDCLLWSCFPIMNTFFANLHSSTSGKDFEKSLEARFSGYFFAVFQMSKVSGNLISYAVLYGFNGVVTPSNLSATLNKSESNASVEAQPVIIDYTHCGASDCLDSLQLEDTISQYVPANNWALYVLMAVMTLLCVGAVMIHFLCIPDTEEFLALRRKRTVNMTGGKKNVSKPFISSEKVKEDQSVIETTNLCDANQEEVGKDELAMAENKDDRALSFIIITAKDVAAQMVEPRQILLIPMCIYAGLGFGFITSELTRSYSSCVFGVSWVPIHSLFYGVGAAVMCYVTGKISKYLSRNIIVAFAVLCDTAIYLYCRFWDPETASHFSLISIYFALGGTIGGIWTPVSQVLQIITFPDRMDVSTPVWNFWYMGGIGIQFAWSSSMCVDSKIYIQLGLLLTTLLGYVISERLNNRKAEEETEIPPH